MDGVITDFDGGFKKLSGGIGVKEYEAIHGKGSESTLYLTNPYSFFIGLEWIYGGKELVRFALSHFKVVRILSSAGTGDNWSKFKEVQEAKIRWVQSNIPQIEKQNIIIVPFASLKAAQYSGPNQIIVDDKDKTIKQWNEKGGIGILHVSFKWQATVNALFPYTKTPVKLKEIVETL